MCLDDLWIRQKTIQIFHYIKEEKIIIPLLRHYLKDLDPVICREAAFSLSYFGRDDGINEIIFALGQGPLETYYKSIRSLGRLNHREPLWKLIHQKRSEAEYAQFGHWQPVANEEPRRKRTGYQNSEARDFQWIHLELDQTQKRLN